MLVDMTSGADQVPVEYRMTLRWFCWRVGNNYAPEIFSNLERFVSSFALFNNGLNLQEIGRPTQYSFGAALERAEAYMRAWLKESDSPLDSICPEDLEYSHLSDYRYGVCRLAEKLVRRDFAMPHLDPRRDEQWLYCGSEMELLFAVYINNIKIDGDLQALNHGHAVSRVAVLLTHWWDPAVDPEDSGFPLDDWETELH